MPFAGSLLSIALLPLLLGILKGVVFFWTVEYMLQPVLLSTLVL